MIEVLQETDQQLFLWLNSLHASFLDPVMYWITNKYTWFPFYGLLAIGIFSKYRWEGFRMILILGLIILACDQLTSGLMKPLFERLRPCHNPSISDQIHLVKGCGGRFGFASSHAANTFGLATGVWLLLHNWSSGFIWGFVWAALVSYSRIYVGVHYPLDIVVGGLIGVLIAILFFQLYQTYRNRVITTFPKNYR